MADWYGTSRSNYFAVKDVAAFKTEMAKHSITVWDKDTLVAIGAESFHGDWPSYDADTDTDFDLSEKIIPHLADDSICVLISAGAEKMRYVTGFAEAFNNKGERESVSLDRIYDFAEQRWGPNVEITHAEY